MVGELITLPVRIWIRSTKFVLRTAEELTGQAVAGVSHVVGALAGNGKDASHRSSAIAEPVARTPPSPQAEELHEDFSGAPLDVAGPPSEAAPEFPGPPLDVGGQPSEIGPEPEHGPTSPGETAIVAEPVHVSEEAVLVRESAEPGAEDGAGAAVTVREPWKGYERMRANAVIQRLADAGPAELAAVQLYESANRGRQTVLAAVERELRTATDQGSHHRERN
jgi:hypothetical protein